MNQATRIRDDLSQVDELKALYGLTDHLYRAQSLDDVYAAALETITSTLGCGRASILLFDNEAVMRFVAWRGLSDDYRVAVDGHTPWKRGQRGAVPLYIEDIDETDEPQDLKNTIKRENIRGLAFIPLVSNGGVIGKFMTYYEAPHAFTPREQNLAVTIARQVGFSVERAFAEAARKGAEQQLRESEERFRLMAEQAPVMIWLSDAQGACLHLNRMLREFWGVEEDDVPTFDWRTTIHDEDCARIMADMIDAVGKRAGIQTLGRYRDAGGRYRTLQTDARPRFDQNGEFLGMIGINIDVTEREEAERARDVAERQRELLLAELNHRVKNTLAVVQGIAHQTFKGADEKARKAFEGRLVALSTAHNLLTRANWENASLDQLVADSLETAAPHAHRIVKNGPHVLLPPRQALAIALALHELFTNAVKYGALSNDTGVVELTWKLRQDGGKQVDMEWRERGGPPAEKPVRRGFGSVLLERTLAVDLNGYVKTDFGPQGLVCTISFEL